MPYAQRYVAFLGRSRCDLETGMDVFVSVLNSCTAMPSDFSREISSSVN